MQNSLYSGSSLDTDMHIKWFSTYRCRIPNNRVQVSGLIFQLDLPAMSTHKEVSASAPYMICSAEPPRDYAVFAESPLYGLRKTPQNIWWMAPVKPCGLQISYNVIPLLVWFPSMTLREEQSATFSKNMVPRFKYPEGGGKKINK